VAPQNIVRVVLWMSGALLSFSAMAVSVRVLAATLGVMEILALRAGLGLMVMATLVAARADLRATINRRHLRLHLFRNTVHVGASYLWAMSLLLIPLAMAFALEFTTPAWTLLLAAPVLGERLTASRIGAVVFGLVGVLVILRPGLATFQPGGLLTLVAAFGLAITLIATKKLTRTDSTFAIVFWMMLIQLPLALIGSDPLFVTKLNQGQVPAVIGIGVSGLVSHYCLTNAFQAGDAGVVVPLDFMRIPLIAVIG
jgi:drug/metabolite transporter (DMT)-like permease